MKPVTLYTTPLCGYCHAAKRLLIPAHAEADSYQRTLMRTHAGDSQGRENLNLCGEP